MNEEVIELLEEAKKYEPVNTYTVVCIDQALEFLRQPSASEGEIAEFVDSIKFLTKHYSYTPDWAWENKLKQALTYLEQLQAENDELKEGHTSILYRIAYTLQKFGKESTLFLIEQALQGENKKPTDEAPIVKDGCQSLGSPNVNETKRNKDLKGENNA
jgi:hypothetical protein